MAEATEENPTIQKLVKKIKDLEEEKTKTISEKGQIEAELNKLKAQLEEAESWIL